MTILYAGVVLGALGVLFGLVLTYAGKKFHVEVDERIELVKNCLGGANCGACGYAGCDQFAKVVVEGKEKPSKCVPAGEKGIKEMAKIMGIEDTAPEKMIARVLCGGIHGIAKERYHYDGYKSCAVAAGIAGGPKECMYSCIGLGDCMDHCAFNAISMVDGVAHVDEDKCRACGTCVAACPRGAIQLLPASQSVIVTCRNKDVAKFARAVCMNACIGCGRCKKECAYGAIEVIDGYAHIDPVKCTRCGACAEVCPCKCIVDLIKQSVGAMERV